MEKSDHEIFYSRAVKSGKRIYYLDVKKNRKGDYFIAITESKKIVMATDNEPQVTYEKHKIFLYREDVEDFLEGLLDVISFVNSGEDTANSENENNNAIKINVTNLDL